LFIVPSCPFHNLEQSEDVEYVRNVICGQLGTNDVAAQLFATVRRSYEHTPALFTATFRNVRTVIVDGEETGAFPIDLPRHRSVMRAIAHAIYYRDNGKRHDGGFGVFSPSMAHRDSVYQGRPDPADGFRRYLESGAFTPMPVSNPRVFQYGVLDIGEGQLFYRFLFYEGFIVHAWTRPFDPSPLLYLPMGNAWVCYKD
jgi:hypothetical protein